MFMTVANAVRPNVARDQCGARGEILFQFADMLEKNFSGVRVQKSIEPDVLLQLVAGLQVADEYRLLKLNALRVLAGKPVEEALA